ncbi:SusD/RagB family nutrient-binding outer membrane lipoprotein [Chitinophaga arvensicola]|uniref:Starch-binding associating with outer membrane n=1 Tax=Chitinophaga arvensicola TaxID=29529 RepID=A0A1I0QXC6_9BACT|nr:SusD/RagB family nutrient-binding outer membrane lipoprotein [Chitinophaga arvensicola]SEW32444.1 Starch-binding associating with outer membrane [Chitinophaga arvensicola]
MKSHMLISIFVAGLLLVTGCTKDFDEINTNPNSSQQVDQPQLLLPAILKNSVRNYFYSSTTRGNIVGDYYANQYVSGFDNAWAPSEVQGYFLWDNFSQLRDVENLLVLSRKKQLQNFEGVGLVIKAWLFQVMTDIYGDIPFKEATGAKVNGVFLPVFDTQEDVYYGMLDMLKTANTLLTNGKDGLSGDIMLENKPLRWRMFANSLRLRLLMRISGKSNLKINVGTEINAIISDPVQFPIFTSHENQAAFTFLNDVGFEIPGFNDAPLNDIHLSVTMEKYLKALNDPRIGYYASPTPAGIRDGKKVFAGVPNGIAAGAEAVYNGGRDFQSSVSPALLPLASFPQASRTAAQGLLMTYAEVQFILAEARERGLISSGDAATYYANGIKDQFAYLAERIAGKFDYPKAADITPADSYYTQTGVAYTGTPAEKLNKIRIQKWFALFNNGFEGWSEWRRTGVPADIKTGPNSAITVWPRRARYPISEQRLNQQHYQEAVSRQGADDMLTRIWWDK